MFLDQAIHPFDENSVFLLKKLVTRVDPLLNRLLYKPSSYDERIIVRKFPCFGPTLNVRG